LISKDIIDAFSDLAKDRGIDRTNLGTIIEDLFYSLIHKKYGEEVDNFSVIVNMEKGEIEIYQEKVVVNDVVDEISEINIKEAKKIESDLVLGDPYIEIINPEDFGRRLINTGKQFLAQSIRSIEKQAIFNEFDEKKGMIVSGYVNQIQRDNVFITCDSAELTLPKSEQIPNDRYRRGESVRGIISSVEITSKGPEIIVSRSSDDFLIKLFEMEVPEIEDEIIEIRSVSRAPGDRSKVVVYSSDVRIDAVGACVGMRGSRIQSIVRELNGEKIDIINFSDQPEILLTRSIAPAKPIKLLLDEEKPYAVMVFDDEELAIAIGRNGQNISLASDVTGFTIDAISKSDYNKQHGIVDENDLSTIKGFSSKQLEILNKNEISLCDDFLDKKDEILALKGFGEKSYEKLATKIKEHQVDA
jgi:N utilization substance protein A